MPGSMPSVIRVMIHAYADDRHDPVHVYLGETARAPPGPARRAVISARSCRSSSPSGSAASPSIPAAGGYALPGDVALLASNESPYPPIPAVVEAVDRGAGRPEPLPRPDATRRCARALERPLRRPGAPDRDRQRLVRHPARRRRGAAGAGQPSSSTPGRASASTRTWRPRRARGRSTVPLDADHTPRPRRDARGDQRRHAARRRLQPEQPDVHRAAAGRDRRVRARRSRATSP